MKLKNRLIVAFLIIVLIPVILSLGLIMVISHFQLSSIEKTYEISGTTLSSFSNSIHVLSRLTETPYEELTKIAKDEPEQFQDEKFLSQYNERLQKKRAFLLVRKDREIAYAGGREELVDELSDQLPPYVSDAGVDAAGNGLYVSKAEVLLKQIDFRYGDGSQGSLFIVTDVSNVIPEVQEFFTDLVMGILIVLVVTAAALIYWIYRSVINPLGRMQVAANNIKEGNLDFRLETKAEDELGMLARDLEDMRKRLKDNAEEKVQFDRESKELISNISHDLKTPVTAIKGYAEGIMDGVADTPEKMDKYIRTIYNKANEMNLLINELTLYSKIDTNRIPYDFSTLSVKGYFDDCAEDLSVELESKNVAFEYHNYVEGEVRIIADAEQIRRVIHNIVNNSLKYMDKQYPRINLRVKDVGDFVQIELADNGKGIGAKDLTHIFERFYRTDASRNSSKGGSGIGLSIVKKIIEEHGGKIWATSKESEGTTLFFVLRKYQEVPIGE